MDDWGVELQGTALAIPVFSPSGTYQFDVIRHLCSEPRYSYSPHGSRITMQLFGVHRALATILSENTIVVCEGSSDVMALHAAGVTNAVALLGSSFSKVQWSLLWFLANHVILWEDSDPTGRSLGEKALEAYGDSHLSRVEVQGCDPAEAFARRAPLLDMYDEVINSGSKRYLFHPNGRIIKEMY